mmetsp:Transcript_12019/g.29427  ORF Transcript_12019/g.29427 Transcript_12019/m.29427 type:complete len:200 (+) Transcript_12019:1030-1629(+)
MQGTPGFDTLGLLCTVGELVWWTDVARGELAVLCWAYCTLEFGRLGSARMAVGLAFGSLASDEGVECGHWAMCRPHWYVGRYKVGFEQPCSGFGVRVQHAVVCSALQYVAVQAQSVVVGLQFAFDRRLYRNSVARRLAAVFGPWVAAMPDRPRLSIAPMADVLQTRNPIAQSQKSALLVSSSLHPSPTASPPPPSHAAR